MLVLLSRQRRAGNLPAFSSKLACLVHTRLAPHQEYQCLPHPRHFSYSIRANSTVVCADCERLTLPLRGVRQRGDSPLLRVSLPRVQRQQRRPHLPRRRRRRLRGLPPPLSESWLAPIRGIARPCPSHCSRLSESLLAPIRVIARPCPSHGSRRRRRRLRGRRRVLSMFRVTHTRTHTHTHTHTHPVEDQARSSPRTPSESLITLFVPTGCQRMRRIRRPRSRGEERRDC